MSVLQELVAISLTNIMMNQFKQIRTLVNVLSVMQTNAQACLCLSKYTKGAPYMQRDH